MVPGALIFDSNLPTAQLHTACAVRMEVEESYARSRRDDALPALGWLRRHGLRVGVVSDCTHELPDLWTSLLVARFVDATVFSVVIGHRKPHLSLYQRVCRQLGIAPSEAIYVGDGGSNELTGATAAGIPAVRLVTEDAADALVYDAEPAWSGPVIHSLTASPKAPSPTFPATSRADRGPRRSGALVARVGADPSREQKSANHKETLPARR
ncbi:MAG: HAD-IA family hydrolase [Acidimicrobiales bacterium]